MRTLQPIHVSVTLVNYSEHVVLIRCDIELGITSDHEEEH